MWGNCFLGGSLELSKCFFLRAVGDYLAYLIHIFQRVFNLRFLL